MPIMNLKLLIFKHFFFINFLLNDFHFLGTQDDLMEIEATKIVMFSFDVHGSLLSLYDYFLLRDYIKNYYKMFWFNIFDDFLCMSVLISLHSFISLVNQILLNEIPLVVPSI
jgi:hypothetical protein